MDDDGGFSEWYRREHPRLVSSLAVVSGQLEVAVEAVDEAFARALDRWVSVSNMTSPAAWTYRVALNRLRRQMRRAAMENLLQGRQQPNPVQDLPDPDVWRAVQSLPLRQRTAVVLRYVADFTEADIGEVMGISRGTVAATLSAARRSLAVLLSDPEMEDTRHG
jgi:RNA polymerase sigma factor (sigma-70 family)